MAHARRESLEVMRELIQSQEKMTLALDRLNTNLEQVRITVEPLDEFSDGEMQEGGDDDVEERVEVEEEEEEEEEEEGETVVPSGSVHHKKRKLK